MRYHSREHYTIHILVQSAMIFVVGDIQQVRFIVYMAVPGVVYMCVCKSLCKSIYHTDNNLQLVAASCTNGKLEIGSC